MVNVKYKPTLEKYLRANLQIRVLGIMPKLIFYGAGLLLILLFFLLYITADFLADRSLDLVWTIILGFVLLFTICLLIFKESLLFLRAKGNLKNLEWIALELNDEYFKLSQSNGEELKYKLSRIGKVYESKDFIFKGSNKHIFVSKSDLSETYIETLKSLGKNN